jgi:hypothetical protein
MCSLFLQAGAHAGSELTARAFPSLLARGEIRAGSEGELKKRNQIRAKICGEWDRPRAGSGALLLNKAAA